MWVVKKVNLKIDKLINLIKNLIKTTRCFLVFPMCFRWLENLKH